MIANTGSCTVTVQQPAHMVICAMRQLQEQALRSAQGFAGTKQASSFPSFLGRRWPVRAAGHRHYLQARCFSTAPPPHSAQAQPTEAAAGVMAALMRRGGPPQVAAGSTALTPASWCWGAGPGAVQAAAPAAAAPAAAAAARSAAGRRALTCWGSQGRPAASGACWCCRGRCSGRMWRGEWRAMTCRCGSGSGTWRICMCT